MITFESMIEIIIANIESEYKVIAKLADATWRQHYIPIIGVDQVNYMVEKFQTTSAISNQIEQGYEYYIINYNRIPVGYISIKKEEDSLFISKIYILNAYRGKKIGKESMLFIEEKAKIYNFKTITLTVNKNNVNSILFYEKFGFKKIDAIVIDIGNGYVMDDFKMEKSI